MQGSLRSAPKNLKVSEFGLEKGRGGGRGGESEFSCMNLL